MSEPKITYDGLLENKDFIDSTYHVLQGLGENVAYDPKDILDTFLTKKRYFDTNILSTYNTGQDMKDLDEDRKQLLRYSLEQVEQMPTFFQEGGAPAGAAVGSFGKAAGTDAWKAINKS